MVCNAVNTEVGHGEMLNRNQVMKNEVRQLFVELFDWKGGCKKKNC